MTPKRIAAVLMAGVLGAGSAAMAQPAAAPATAAASAGKPDSTTISGIVVQARPTQTEQSFAVAVGKFVRAQGAPTYGHALERWDKKICPLTAGLSDDDNDLVSQRIKDVAQRVGAPSDGLCRGENIMVVFSDDPVELMARARDGHAHLLGSHFISQRKSLAAFQPPMASWYETSTDGKRDAAYLTDGSNAQQVRCIDLLCHGILPPLHPRFLFAFIVIDSGWTKGKPIGVIADAVAMLALTRPTPRAGGCSALPTVLDLLESACPATGWADGLTSYDEAYLKGLYEFNRGKFASQITEIALPERAAIARRIIRDAGPAAAKSVANGGPP